MTYHPSANLDNLPGRLPTGNVPEDVDNSQLAATAAEWMSELKKDYLAENAIWRDMLSLTDTFRTFYSPDLVSDVFNKLSKEKSRSDFHITDHETRLEKLSENSWLDIDLKFSTSDGKLTGRCAAVVSMIQNGAGQWKIWMIRTWLENFEGHGHPDIPRPRNDFTNGSSAEIEHVYDAIVVGGGQSGLGAAGRFQALGIDYILFDDRPSIGASWSQRYDSLKWHTIKDYGSLPFGKTFSPEQPLFLPTREIGAGYKNWAVKHGINAQEATSVESSSWDETSQNWTVYTSGKDGKQEWSCRNLVLCIGSGAKSAVSPPWASEEQIKSSGFKGTILHGSKYQNVNGHGGQQGIVIGTANTAHDVAEDMVDAGMESVTMVQRGNTFVVPVKFIELAQAQYGLDIPIEQLDREQITQPLKVLSDIANAHIWAAVRAQPKLWDDLEAAGLKTERYGRLFDALFGRFGGHYVDIGNCDRIIRGEVKIKTEAVKGLTKDGLAFDDGSELPADLIVLCTGFNHDFRLEAQEIVGKEIADKMDDFWGLDGEGEIRGYAKQHEGHHHLWYFAGEARNARFYSTFLALQLHKLALGESLRPYREGQVCNSR